MQRFHRYWPGSVDRLIDMALEEDLGRGDVTSEAIFRQGEQVAGTFLAKSDLCVAGLDLVVAICKKVDPTLECFLVAEDGDWLTQLSPCMTIRGSALGVLAAERTALNFLQRLSGIATMTARFVKAISGTRATIVDTRKTVPGYRFLDKYAVRVGGGNNHRFDLGAGVLVKDNHIAATGGVMQAVALLNERVPHLLKIEVEVTNPSELKDALLQEVDVVLLDNMTVEQVRAAMALVERHRGKRPLVEVSGGMTLSTVRAYAETGVDLISVGALTHSVIAADISLEIQKEAA